MLSHYKQHGKSLIMGLASIVLAYVMICSVFYLNQKSLIFIGASSNPEFEQFWQSRRQVLVSQGKQLEYWHLENSQVPTGWLLYFGGNAENVVYNLPMFQQLSVTNVVALNYRGYGRSEGEASEENLLADALALYDSLARRHGEAFQHVRVMGRSLGTSVAAYLAANRSVAGVILVSPFDELTDVAKGHFPWLPVSLLLHQRFDVGAYIENKNLPNLLMITGKDDRVIPPAHSDSLFARWAGEKRQVELPGNHNSLTQSLGYYPSINNYVARPIQELPERSISHGTHQNAQTEAQALGFEAVNREQ